MYSTDPPRERKHYLPERSRTLERLKRCRNNSMDTHIQRASTHTFVPFTGPLTSNLGIKTPKTPHPMHRLGTGFRGDGSSGPCVRLLVDGVC